MPPAESELPPRLALRGITKHYPGVLANDAIDLTVSAGETHALLGENGAGKSTLVKIIYGVVRADAGEMLWHGSPAAVANPAEARRLGIGMVFQHFNLFETLTIAENISLGLSDPPERRALAERISDLSQRYGLPVDPHRPVHGLSVAERQRVEIIRALLQDPALLIMDEPTSVLTPQETVILFETLGRLRDEGRSILYISHKLEEIRGLCDRATVLRHGRVVASCDPKQESPESLARMMVGADIPFMHRSRNQPGKVLLELDGVDQGTSDPFGTSLRDVSLALRAGEVVGIAGVTGNGQRELLRVLSGETRVRPRGKLKLDGAAGGHLGPAGRRARGLAFVPEERLGRGAVPMMSLSENVVLTAAHRNLTAAGVLRWPAIRRFAAAVMERFDVRAPGVEAPARSLSGGNLQKFILGREIAQRPSVLILAYPTWGVDVGAATAIHQAIMDLRADGAGVLIVSEDLDELFELSDRIAVIANGRLSEAYDSGSASVEELGLLMAGGRGMEEAADASPA